MQTSNYLRYRWTSIWLCAGTGLGLGFVVWFSLAENLNTGTLLLWALACFVIGGLTGFIFSVPKIISDGNAAASTPQPATSATMTTPQAAAAPATVNAVSRTKAQENTNLTQISDWLTKILIGAGLVEIKQVPGFVHHIAIVMGTGLASGDQVAPVITACAGLILYFSTWGFITGYLVMKLVLTEQFVASANEDDAPQNATLTDSLHKLLFHLNQIPMTTQINDSCATDGSANSITLQVKTGFAQTYVTSVTLDGNPLVITPPADASGNYDGDFSISLGTNAALKGVLLEVTAKAVINMTPPSTSMLLSLSGGAAPKSFQLGDTGSGKATGDEVDYYAGIALT